MRRSGIRGKVDNLEQLSSEFGKKESLKNNAEYLGAITSCIRGLNLISFSGS